MKPNQSNKTMSPIEQLKASAEAKVAKRNQARKAPSGPIISLAAQIRASSFNG